MRLSAGLLSGCWFKRSLRSVCWAVLFPVGWLVVCLVVACVFGKVHVSLGWLIVCLVDCVCLRA